jgi:hypothetical protein
MYCEALQLSLQPVAVALTRTRALASLQDVFLIDFSNLLKQ